MEAMPFGISYELAMNIFFIHLFVFGIYFLISITMTYSYSKITPWMRGKLYSFSENNGLNSLVALAYFGFYIYLAYSFINGHDIIGMIFQEYRVNLLGNNGFISDIATLYTKGLMFMLYNNLLGGMQAIVGVGLIFNTIVNFIFFQKFDPFKIEK